MKHPDRTKVTIIVPSGIRKTMAELSEQALSKLNGGWYLLQESLTEWRDDQKIYEAEFLERTPSREEQLAKELQQIKAAALAYRNRCYVGGGPTIHADPSLVHLYDLLRGILETEL